MTLEEQAATLDRDSIVELLKSQQQLTTEIERLRFQNAWLQRLLYGRKSERRLIDPNDQQLTLGEWLKEDGAETEESVTVPEHRRRKKRTPALAQQRQRSNHRT